MAESTTIYIKDVSAGALPYPDAIPKDIPERITISRSGELRNWRDYEPPLITSEKLLERIIKDGLDGQILKKCKLFDHVDKIAELYKDAKVVLLESGAGTGKTLLSPAIMHEAERQALIRRKGFLTEKFPFRVLVTQAQCEQIAHTARTARRQYGFNCPIGFTHGVRAKQARWPCCKDGHCPECITKNRRASSELAERGNLQAFNNVGFVPTNKASGIIDEVSRYHGVVVDDLQSISWATDKLLQAVCDGMASGIVDRVHILSTGLSTSSKDSLRYYFGDRGIGFDVYSSPDLPPPHSISLTYFDEGDTDTAQVLPKIRTAMKPRPFSYSRLLVDLVVHSGVSLPVHYMADGSPMGNPSYYVAVDSRTGRLRSRTKIGREPFFERAVTFEPQNEDQLMVMVFLDSGRQAEIAAATYISLPVIGVGLIMPVSSRFYALAANAGIVPHPNEAENEILKHSDQLAEPSCSPLQVRPRPGCSAHQEVARSPARNSGLGHVRLRCPQVFRGEGVRRDRKVRAGSNGWRQSRAATDAGAEASTPLLQAQPVRRHSPICRLSSNCTDNT